MSLAAAPPRAANSMLRLRTSACPPMPLTTHWRTLPDRWSSRLPTELEFSLGRHQSRSAGIASTAARIFVGYSRQR
jgi:hypothetical protein